MNIPRSLSESRANALHDPAQDLRNGYADMRTSPRLSTILAGACAALLCSAHAAASPAQEGYTPAYATDLPQADYDGLSLKAGEFMWLPGADATRGASPVTLLVNLQAQRAYLYRDGQRLAVTTVSTGKKGNDTPTGVFPIMGKARTHFSNRYNNAPMPYMQRLTRWGHALHAGQVRPYPASHGCVRLPAEFARQLFSLTQVGDLVIIAKDDTPKSLAIALKVADRDPQLALTVGVTEPLPPIVFYEPGKKPLPQASVSASVGSGISL
jgi:lipoprotein-anchoring transpeptidase ErfK/SrfK